MPRPLLQRKTVPPLASHSTKPAKKKRQSELKSQVAHEQRHLRLAISKMRQQVEAIRHKFGFVSYPQQPRWANFENAVGKMDSFLLQHQISNKSCHNLLRRLALPPGISQLLGLNLNYYVKPSSINSTIENTFKRLPNDIRRLYHLLKDVVGGNYIPSLYLNSDFKFYPASDRLEKAIA